MKKTFVLDTNVLLHNAGCLQDFEDNTVVLPMVVIEELDKFKSRNDELGRNARHVIRKLDILRERGRLGEGVSMDNGGVMRIMTGRNLKPETGLDPDLPDNRIIRVAYHLNKTEARVIFVSKDINARLKADALGIEAQDYEKQKIKFDEMFTGFREVMVDGKMIDDFYESSMLEMKNLDAFPNEFILLTDKANPKHSALGRVQNDQQVMLLNPRYKHAWNIKPRSKEQRMALELLLDPAVQIVTLVGQAGTGKTLLALAAGLEMTIRHHEYEKMLVSRPIMPLGRDIGYLPGDKNDKLLHWMQPIFDNLNYLMSTKGGGEHDQHKAQKKVDDLLKDNVVELEALTYIRGRSIPRQYVVVDEAQNLTPHEVKTITSRAGEGTKMVLTGDPYQIDNPYLDSSSNGLTYAAECLKTHEIHGHVYLQKSERSPLAAVAASML